MHDNIIRNVPSTIPTQGVTTTLDSILDVLFSQPISASVSENTQHIKNGLRTFLQHTNASHGISETELEKVSGLLASNVGYTPSTREGIESGGVSDYPNNGKVSKQPSLKSENMTPYSPYYREKEKNTHDPHTCDEICAAPKKPNPSTTPYSPLREIALSDMPQTSLPLPSDADGNSFVENVVMLVKNG